MRFDTSCESCVFAKVRNNKQTSCVLGCLEKYDNVADLEVNGVTYKKIIGRVCMYRRYNDWKGKRKLKDCIDIVKKEVVPPLNFIIKHSGQNLEQTLQSLSKLCANGKVRIIIAYTTKNFKEIKSIADKYLHPEITYFCSILDNELNDYFDIVTRESFRLVSNGYTCIVHSGREVDPNVINKINDLINVHMKRVALIKGIDSDHLQVYNNVLFKSLDKNAESSFENLLISNNGNNMIFTWERVNEIVGCLPSQ